MRPCAGIVLVLLMLTATLTLTGSGCVTGTWQGDATGVAPSTIGCLLTQAGNAVTGTCEGYTLENGQFSGGLFTSTITISSDATVDFALNLSSDARTLSGTIIRHQVGKPDLTSPTTLTKRSNEPNNPYPTPPSVISISPSNNETGLSRTNLVISIQWSQPMGCGNWDIELEGPINGVQTTISGTYLVSGYENTYDPNTYTIVMPVRSDPSDPLRVILDANATYTLRLESTVDANVDWRNAYGVLAWSNIGSAYSITFTTGS